MGGWVLSPRLSPRFAFGTPPKSPQNQAIRHPQQATSPGKLFLHLLPNAHTVTITSASHTSTGKGCRQWLPPLGWCRRLEGYPHPCYQPKSCPQILCITPTSHVPTKNPAHGRASGWWCRQWLPHAVTQVARLRKPRTAPALAGTVAQCRAHAGLDQRPGMWGRWRGGLAMPLTPPATVHQSGTRHPA